MTPEQLKAMTLEAFERIARQISLARPGAPLDSGSEEAPPPPVVTREMAAILEDMVRFYERFAATNSNDPRLKREKVGEAAAIEGHGRHPRARHHVAHLGALGFQVDRAF